jgi:hypothetical protein
MSNLRYVQKIDLSETFSKLVVKVSMSGQYKKSNYSRTEVLDLWKGQSAQNALLAPSVKSITSKQSGCMQVFLK